VHNEFMPLKISPPSLKSRLVTQAAFYFSTTGSFTPHEAIDHATATCPDPTR
jgi:hypothetical protein